MLCSEGTNSDYFLRKVALLVTGVLGKTKILLVRETLNFTEYKETFSSVHSSAAILKTKAKQNKNISHHHIFLGFPCPFIITPFLFLISSFSGRSYSFEELGFGLGFTMLTLLYFHLTRSHKGYWP